MFFSGCAGEGLEPVSVVRCAFIERPALHGVGDVVGDGGIQRGTFGQCLVKSFEDRFRKTFAHAFNAEHVRSEFVDVEPDLFGCGNLDCGDPLDRIYSCLVHVPFSSLSAQFIGDDMAYSTCNANFYSDTISVFR